MVSARFLWAAVGATVSLFLVVVYVKCLMVVATLKHICYMWLGSNPYFDHAPPV